MYRSFSFGVLPFSWSSLKCLYTFIGVHLWFMSLCGHDLDTHTHLSARGITVHNVYPRKKQTIRSKGLYQCTYRGYKTISDSLVDPRSWEAPVILKWKKSGATRTLSSSRSGKKYGIRDHEPNGHPDWAPEVLCAESQLSVNYQHPPIIGCLSVPLKILDVKINSRVLPPYKIFFKKWRTNMTVTTGGKSEFLPRHLIHFDTTL